MKKREMNALLKKITTKNRLDVKKIPDLTYEERKNLIIEMVRRRLPIVAELIPEPFDEKPFDMSWLHSCAYFYNCKSNGYNLLCTGEQMIMYKLEG